LKKSSKILAFFVLTSLTCFFNPLYIVFKSVQASGPQHYGLPISLLQIDKVLFPFTGSSNTPSFGYLSGLKAAVNNGLLQFDSISTDKTVINTNYVIINFKFIFSMFLLKSIFIFYKL